MGCAWLLWQGVLFASTRFDFRCPEDPEHRTFRLFSVLQRHIGCFADLDVLSIFDGTEQ